jgi:hypothetical protein
MFDIVRHYIHWLFYLLALGNFVSTSNRLKQNILNFFCRPTFSTHISHKLGYRSRPFALCHEPKHQSGL